MIILDENFPESQRLLLRGWRIAVLQIGLDVGRKGMQDEEIIPLLLSLKHPTFFTLDFDFYRPNLRHAGYCLAVLEVAQTEAAFFTRRLLKHRLFNSSARRMGAVLRLSHTAITFWRLELDSERRLSWSP